jgi:hypothetical protein
LADKDNPRLDVSAQQSFWLIYREHSLQQGARTATRRARTPSGCDWQIQQEIFELVAIASKAVAA